MVIVFFELPVFSLDFIQVMCRKFEEHNVNVAEVISRANEMLETHSVPDIFKENLLTITELFGRLQHCLQEKQKHLEECLTLWREFGKRLDDVMTLLAETEVTCVKLKSVDVFGEDSIEKAIQDNQVGNTFYYLSYTHQNACLVAADSPRWILLRNRPLHFLDFC